jgi:hypothetical protein
MASLGYQILKYEANFEYFRKNSSVFGVKKAPLLSGAIGLIHYYHNAKVK